MASAIQRHDAILDGVLKARSGHIFKKVGDAFCVAFERASDAALAAVEIERSLKSEDFSAVNGLRVRIALHTGEAQERDDDYFGPTVNRVARLIGLAYGGQILVSGVCADLIANELRLQVSLHDLGTHRLRDLSEPEHVFQLCAPDLPQDFPPLRSVGVLPNNLPLQLTSFVGRDNDLAEIKEQLSRSRLVTLVGSGGVGKTRLAIQSGAGLLERFPNGVWLVELATISDSALMPHVLASALNVRDTTERPILDSVLTALANKSALIILDNCEHLIEEVARIADVLLRSCPNVRILATSRQPIQITGEWVYHVAPLPLQNAVTLFAQRAQASDNRFAMTPENEPIVTDICNRLDGIALAIELAAARVKVLSPTAIRDRLKERLRILTGGSRTDAPRHQTLRALIDWSYHLLNDDEMSFFRRSAVFAGSFSLEGAAEVCCGFEEASDNAIELVGSLVEKSLLTIERSETAERYRLLESTREYALEKCKEFGEYDTLSRRHAEFYRTFAQGADGNFHKIPQADWFDQLRAEVENLRGALQWALGEGHDPQLGAALAGLLERFWYETGLLGEGSYWVERAFKALGESAEDAITARLWLARAVLLSAKERGAESCKAGERACALYEKLGDKRGAAYALRICGIVLRDSQRSTQADQYLRRAVKLFEECDEAGGLALALTTLSSVYAYRGDLETARKLCQRALETAAANHAEFAFTLGSLYLADLEFQAGNFDAALSYGENALSFSDRAKSARISANLRNNLAAYRIALNQHEQAASDARQALGMLRETQNSYDIGIAVQHLALIAALRGEVEHAGRLTGYVDSYFERSGIRREPTEKWCYDRIMSALRDRLAEKKISLLMHDGASLSERQAIDEALEVSEPLSTTV